MSEDDWRSGRRAPRSVEGAARRMARDEVERLLGMAEENVSLALEDGDIKVSMWFIDHIAKTRGAWLTKPLAAKIGKLDLPQLVKLSEVATQRALRGELTEAQLKFVHEALARHAALRGAQDLDGLREEVAALSRDAAAPALARLNGLTPAWGRFTQETEGE